MGEDMKANTLKELRRVLEFLGHGHVSEEKIACAVEASTMERLQQSENTDYSKDATRDNFFGTRGNTEAKETLEYSDELLRHFENHGVFEIAHKLLGYTARAEAPGG